MLAKMQRNYYKIHLILGGQAEVYLRECGRIFGCNSRNKGQSDSRWVRVAGLLSGQCKV